MTLTTFDPPLAPSSISDAPETKVLTASFGDGYTMTAPDGLNHIRQVRNLTWDALYPFERKEIVDFFRARGGWQPFLYALDGLDEKPIRWTCVKWSEGTVSGGFHRIDAEFRQNFSVLA